MPLVIGRSEGQRIIIDERISIEIEQIRRGYVKLSINAPDEVVIRRAELKREEVTKA